MIFSNFLNRVSKFEKEAHSILQTQESSKSRIVGLDQSYQKLTNLNLKQEDLFKQAFTCLEKECYRAAHVMAWAAFMDFIENKLCEDKCVKINRIRQKWNIKTVDDLRDSATEFAIIECVRDIGLCTKTEMKALHGLLNRRNECAHPTDYYPQFNETLGYISEIFQRLEKLIPKTII